MAGGGNGGDSEDVNVIDVKTESETAAENGSHANTYFMIEMGCTASENRARTTKETEKSPSVVSCSNPENPAALMEFLNSVVLPPPIDITHTVQMEPTDIDEASLIAGNVYPTLTIDEPTVQADAKHYGR